MLSRHELLRNQIDNATNVVSSQFILGAYVQDVWKWIADKYRPGTGRNALETF